MEEAADLANYLPLSFKTPKEQKYIVFLAYQGEIKVSGTIPNLKSSTISNPPSNNFG